MFASAFRRLRPCSVLPSRRFASSSPAVFDASRLTVRRTEAPRSLPALEGLAFGAVQSDHMLEIDWSASAGWSSPVISPTHPLLLDPAASCLHYGLQVRGLDWRRQRMRRRRRVARRAF